MLEDPYEYQESQRATISPYWAVLGAILFGFALAGALWSGKLLAAPVFATTSDGITVTLTDEPCALSAVANLKYRATWVEKEKTFEGSWSPHQEAGVVIAYFDDKTVALIPIQAFHKVVGA